MTPGILLILTGPTASGKNAILASLIRKYPHLSRVVTTTTRLPREDEVDGQDYYFVSQDSFQKMIKEGQFLEYVGYAGNYYGTTKEEIKKVLDYRSCVWIIDVTRATRVGELFQKSFEPETARQLIEKTLVIYIDSPLKAIRQRLRKRGMDEVSMEKRIQQDIQNWKKLKNRFKNVVINNEGKLDEAVYQIIKLIKG